MKTSIARPDLPSSCSFIIAVVRLARFGAIRHIILPTAFLALLMAGCVTNSSSVGVREGVPEVLAPPKGQRKAFSLAAKGYQIYECQPKKDDATLFEWIFKAPEADLFDRSGRKVGTHFKGPTWKHGDGSSVVGANPRSYVKDTNAIPWLLLDVKETKGRGVFSKVTSIQRVATVGGKAPPGGCNVSNVGKEIRVPYTATYHFYVAKP